MHRRDFLRSTAAIAGGVAGASVLGAATGATIAGAATKARRYRGTRHGKVLYSDDGGRTWRLLTDFGPELDVQRVKEASKRVTAHVVYGRHGSFNLALQKDGRTWLLA